MAEIKTQKVTFSVQNEKKSGFDESAQVYYEHLIAQHISARISLYHFADKRKPPFNPKAREVEFQFPQEKKAAKLDRFAVMLKDQPVFVGGIDENTTKSLLLIADKIADHIELSIFAALRKELSMLACRADDRTYDIMRAAREMKIKHARTFHRETGDYYVCLCSYDDILRMRMLDLPAFRPLEAYRTETMKGYDREFGKVTTTHKYDVVFVEFPPSISELDIGMQKVTGSCLPPVIISANTIAALDVFEPGNMQILTYQDDIDPLNQDYGLYIKVNEFAVACTSGSYVLEAR